MDIAIESILFFVVGAALRRFQAVPTGSLSFHLGILFQFLEIY
jgi:hypothetical protein